MDGQRGLRAPEEPLGTGPRMPRSVARSRQWEQLPMFMSAREIRSKYQALDGDREDVEEEQDDGHYVDRAETDDEVFSRKADEAWDNYDHRFSGADMDVSLGEHMKRNGVINPVSLQFSDLYGSQGKPQVLGGHHRVAVMHEEKPDALMPVEHFSGSQIAQRSLGRKY